MKTKSKYLLIVTIPAIAFLMLRILPLGLADSSVVQGYLQSGIWLLYGCGLGSALVARRWQLCAVCVGCLVIVFAYLSLEGLMKYEKALRLEGSGCPNNSASALS